MSKKTIPSPTTTEYSIFDAIQSANIPLIKQLLSNPNIDLTVQTTAPLCITGQQVMSNTKLTPFSALCVLYRCYPDKSIETLEALKQISDIFSSKNTYADLVDSQGCTEFMWAVWTKNLDLIKEAHDVIKKCNNNYDFNQQDYGGRTALHVAVQNNVEKGIIEYLINDVKINVDLQDYQEMTALFQAALALGNDLKLNPNTNLVDELLKDGANPNIPCYGKLVLSALCEHMWRLRKGYLDNDNAYRKKKYVEDIKKYTPIVTKIIEKIIQSEKFIPAAKDTATGFSAVHWVCELGKEAPTLLQKLKERGANIDAGDVNGRPTLNWYSDYNIPSIVTKLLKSKANVNTQADNGETAPHALLLNASKMNSTKEKLPTLKLLLDSNNEPPFNPFLEMQGATVQDCLNSIMKKTVDTKLKNDLEKCQELLEEYSDWYCREVMVEPLGAEFTNLDIYDI
ncbi:ankyrin repeat domain-containing protein [Candidatus Tisiphia endosymbiont of Oplodontha viridula]|uniref:ankyrin repeat domain-containing protein n=1 Tax=Candidatus Tisiphia endosymbiont of Oplodontha viridula TaxID=3077925 RepID=UPI0035C8A9CF